jgi:methylenetetrahydrofolate reductase (NADPH)
VLAPASGAFLIPDNHLGRATVSSLAVAHEVANMGVRAIACLNCRDRNGLGFRRDLLTATAYGIEELFRLAPAPTDPDVRPGRTSRTGWLRRWHEEADDNEGAGATCSVP